jgi:hypothetical protein
MPLSFVVLLAACEPAPGPVEAVRPTPDAAIAAGFEAFVVAPNARVSGRDDLLRAEVRDTVLEEYVRASFLRHLSSWAVFEGLERVVDDYAFVTSAVRDAGLPEVLAAVPYLESQFDPERQSVTCSKGPWQFMPEVGHRMGLEIAECSFVDDPEASWAPTLLAPPTPVFERSDYAREGQCRISHCRVDERKDLQKSTSASIRMFKESWDDPDFRASGAAVQLTVASHNGGYDDGRFSDRPSRFNLKPAFEQWAEDKDPVDHARFYGANIRARTPGDRPSPDSVLYPETQHYAYTAIAQHLLAVCYYGQNHADRPAFAPYETHATSWCQGFEIPDRATVLSR